MAQKSIAQLENAELRDYAKENNVFLWQIAKNMSISEPTLLRWMRFQLTEDKKAAFIKAVDSIAGKKEGTVFPKREELLRKSAVLDAIMNGLMNWDKTGEFNEDLYGEIVNEINELEVFK